MTFKDLVLKCWLNKYISNETFASIADKIFQAARFKVRITKLLYLISIGTESVQAATLNFDHPEHGITERQQKDLAVAIKYMSLDNKD